MYTFAIEDHLSVPVKVTKIREGGHARHSVRFAEAILVLSPANPEGVTVCLMALEEVAHLVAPEKDFVERELLLDVGRACDPSNPYARHSIGIRGIWFADSDETIGKSLVFVEGEGKLFDMTDEDMHRLVLTRIIENV